MKLDVEGYFDKVSNNDCYILTRAVDFNSSSAAAAVVGKCAKDGRKKWKLKDGTTLDDFEYKK